MQFARVDTADATPAAKPLLGLDPGYWFKIIEAGDPGPDRAADRPVRRQAR